MISFLPATEDLYADIANLATSPEELYLAYPNGAFPWDIAQLQLLARQRIDLTVALEDNKVVAFANLYHLNPGVSAFIGNVIVAPSHRGKGLGKALTNYMVNLCRTQYGATAHLSVFNFNTKALLMYTGLGFVPYAIDIRQNLKAENVGLIHMKYL